MDIEQLFRKIANDYVGQTELVFAHPNGSIDVDFVNEEGVLAAQVKLKMTQVGGKDFVAVRDRKDKKDLEVLVSPVISAVIAVAVR